MTEAITKLQWAERRLQNTLHRVERLEQGLDDARLENRLIRNELKAVRQDRDRLVGQVEAYHVAVGPVPPLRGYSPDEIQAGAARLAAATAERTRKT